MGIMRLLISLFIFSLIAPSSLADTSTKVLSSKASDANMTLEVIDPYVEMHTGPGRGYPVFHVVEQGEIIEVIKRKPDWYQIRSTKGKIGWTKSTQLARTLQPTGIPVDLPNVGHGDYLKNNWRVGFTGGQVADGDIKGADSFSASIGYRPFSWLGAEMEAGRIYSKKVRGDLYGINVLIEPYSHWIVAPYLLIGKGKMSLDAQPTYTPLGFDSSNYANYAFGANYYLARNFVIRGEYRWYSVSTDNDTVKLEEWKLGFSTFF